MLIGALQSDVVPDSRLQVLSNEPFEERGEFPLGLKRPNTEVIAMWTKNGRVFEKFGTTEATRDALYETTKRLNDAIDRDWINVWAGMRQGRPGTTIILSGVRQHFRANGLGRPVVLHDPPRARIKFGTDDMTLCEYNKDKKRSEPFRHHPTARRSPGTSTRMDSSFRAFCEIMFLDTGSTKDLKINLFGAAVNRVSYDTCLRNRQQVEIEDGPAMVSCTIGRHTFPGDEDMYGAMLYCENTLITAFARPLGVVFSKGRGNRDDEEHFSTVAVINLLKKDGFAPTQEKLEFTFNDPDKEPFWGKVKDMIEHYADEQGTQRDKKNPVRPLILKQLKDLKTKLRDYTGVRGVQSGDEGPLRGVLYTPARERVGDDVETYHTCIEDPITLQDIERKAKTLGTNAAAYAGSEDLQIAGFKKDLTRVFRNSIKWESTGRFIADTDDDLDVNGCTPEDIANIKFTSFNTPAKGKTGAFTIKAIFKELTIPEEFGEVTVGENKRAFPGLKDWETVLKHDTAVLLPHRQSVAAVRFAKELLKIACDRADDIPSDLAKNESVKQRAVRDGLEETQVQCSSCRNWRKVPAAAADKYPPGVEFRCEMESRCCDEPDDYNSLHDVTMSMQDDAEDDDSDATASSHEGGAAVAGPSTVQTTPTTLLAAPVLTPALGSTHPTRMGMSPTPTGQNHVAPAPTANAGSRSKGERHDLLFQPQSILFCAVRPRFDPAGYQLTSSALCWLRRSCGRR